MTAAHRDLKPAVLLDQTVEVALKPVRSAYAGSAAFTAFVFWVLVLDPITVVGRPTWFTADAPLLVSSLRGATLEAGVGLYLLTIGTAVGVLAALVPAFHTHRVVKSHNSARGLEPGWYPAPNSRRRTRYWDGEKWTVGA